MFSYEKRRSVHGIFYWDHTLGRISWCPNDMHIYLKVNVIHFIHYIGVDSIQLVDLIDKNEVLC